MLTKVVKSRKRIRISVLLMYANNKHIKFSNILKTLIADFLQFQRYIALYFMRSIEPTPPPVPTKVKVILCFGWILHIDTCTAEDIFNIYTQDPKLIIL